MLTDLLPLMTDTVQHMLPATRDVFGRGTGSTFTSHLARITYTPGDRLGVASRENAPDAAATVWLLNHPRTVAIGDAFALPAGETLKAVRVERRTITGAILSKVYLQ